MINKWKTIRSTISRRKPKPEDDADIGLHFWIKAQDMIWEPEPLEDLYND